MLELTQLQPWKFCNSNKKLWDSHLFKKEEEEEDTLTNDNNS